MLRYSFVLGLIVSFVITGPSFYTLAKEQAKNKSIELPSSVINIENENTNPNQNEDLPHLKPSEFTKELLESSDEPIENPYLIKILNESSINKSPFALGMRATIFMGTFPLNYKSEESIPNWQYQKVNTNTYDNSSGTSNQQMNYVQQVQKRIKGGLTSKLEQAEDVQNMILLKARQKTQLPLALETMVGAGTKHQQVYNVNPKKVGNLDAYVPAIVEKGEVTYGEVYLVIRGMKREIVVKNVTSQKIGAWLPIQDHLYFTFHATP
ncbi:YfkD family protein [Lederbergia sp. NSJ-179]|uniref:YfkD family protein n=1 Tax=Lederbergia sp. NSJ-179 TaxID=2931402 RepID=UPI001FD04E4B|nr:YfkD family protein [Lederbergia sp. NSJ-179]MCJ7840831.1 YfkD family protein [Lederbergia sp. NSJ-179]